MRLKLGVVSSFPNPVCGIARHTENLCNYLQRDFDLYMLQNLPYQKKWSGCLAWQSNRWLIKNIDVDILWIQHEPGLQIPLEELSQFVNIPRVVTLHQVFEGENHIKADYAVVYFSELADGDRIRYIPHGCRDLSFRISKEEAKNILGLPDKTIIVSTGRIEVRRQFESLLPIFARHRSMEFYFVGAIPDTDYWLFRRYLRRLESQAPENVHFVVGYPVPQYLLDLYCQAADYLLWNNVPTHYSVSGAMQATFEFNKLALTPVGVRLFSYLTDENSFKFYSLNHLDKLLSDLHDDPERRLRLAEDFQRYKFPTVAKMYRDLFIEAYEEQATN